MGKRPAWTNWIAALVTVPLICACSETSRHRVLSFLFDGVPEPGARGAPAGGAPEAVGSQNPEAEQARKRPRPTVYVHAPYRDNRCRACHDPGAGLLYKTAEAGLCAPCHGDVPGPAPFVHGPVAVDACLTCHHYHSSPYPKLLLDAPQDLCFGCHERADLTTGAHHATIGDAACTACHDPHGGQNQYLLRTGEP